MTQGKQEWEKGSKKDTGRMTQGKQEWEKGRKKDTGRRMQDAGNTVMGER